MDEFGLTILDMFTERLEGYIAENQLAYIRQEIISSVAPLENLSVKELKAKCKECKIASSGSKNILISRLLKVKGDQNPPEPVENSKFIKIEKNEFGNYEHKESSLVFDPKERIVTGRQLPSGDIAPLTKKDINKCNQYKFGYILPENLNDKTPYSGDSLEDESDISESELIDGDDEDGDDDEEE